MYLKAFLLLLSSLIITASLIPSVLTEPVKEHNITIPEVILDYQQDYFNCHPNPDYPLLTGNITFLSGNLTIEQGPLKFLYMAYKIGDVYLFDAYTNQELDFRKRGIIAYGMNLSLKGYYDHGIINISMHTESFESKIVEMHVDAFYVTEIIGFANVCCDYYSYGDEANVSECFWYKL